MLCFLLTQNKWVRLDTAIDFHSILSDKITNKHLTQDETIRVLRSTINVLDKEKDNLQESVDEKTERIAYLDDNLSNKVCNDTKYELDYQKHFMLSPPRPLLDISFEAIHLK